MCGFCSITRYKKEYLFSCTHICSITGEGSCSRLCVIGISFQVGIHYYSFKFLFSNLILPRGTLKCSIFRLKSAKLFSENMVRYLLLYNIPQYIRFWCRLTMYLTGFRRMELWYGGCNSHILCCFTPWHSLTYGKESPWSGVLGSRQDLHFYDVQTHWTNLRFCPNIWSVHL